MKQLARIATTILFAATLALIPAQSAGAVDPTGPIPPDRLCFTCWLST